MRAATVAAMGMVIDEVLAVEKDAKAGRLYNSTLRNSSGDLINQTTLIKRQVRQIYVLWRFFHPFRHETL